MKRTIVIPYATEPPTDEDKARTVADDEAALGYSRTSEVEWEQRRTSEMVFSQFPPPTPWLMVGTFDADPHNDEQRPTP